MKIKTFLFAAASFLAVACTGGSNETKISGTLEGVDTVRIFVQDLDLNDAVAVVDGKFEYSCPVNEVAVGSIMVGRTRLSFIPDGSPLVIKANEDGSYQLIAENTESANALITDFYGKIMPRINNINKLTMEWYQAGADEESESYSQLISKRDSILADVDSFINENTSSAAIIPVIQNFASYEDEEMAALIEKLDPALLENSYIKAQVKRFEAIEATKEGKMFTDFTIPDSEGKEVRFSDYIGKGKYVLVDFWASWCGPCRGEIPNLIKVYDKYHGEQFDVLGVAVWDKPEDSKAAAEKLGINYSEIINAQNIPTDAYGINGIPQIMLFGPDGTILKRDLRGEAIEAEIAKYVKPAK